MTLDNSFVLPFKAPFDHIAGRFTVHVNDHLDSNMQQAGFGGLRHTDDLQSERCGNNTILDNCFKLVKEAPMKNLHPIFGPCPNGRGGLHACPDGFFCWGFPNYHYKTCICCQTISSKRTLRTKKIHSNV